MAENSQENSRKRAAHLKEHRFKPEQSGNPGGRPKKRPISDCYAVQAQALLSDKHRRKLCLPKGATYANALALSQFNASIKGKTEAAREIREAIEGKARQRVEITGEDGAPIQFKSDDVAGKIAELTKRIRARGSDNPRED